MKVIKYSIDHFLPTTPAVMKQLFFKFEVQFTRNLFDNCLFHYATLSNLSIGYRERDAIFSRIRRFLYG